MNITKLKLWPELQKLGFVPVRYRAHGKIVSIGASLMKTGVNIDGKPFSYDLITIEPGSFSDRKNYHISGHAKKPVTKELKYWNGNRFETVYSSDTFINDYYPANQVLKVITDILKD